MCTGTIVRDDLLLTAAHCVADSQVQFIPVADQVSQGTPFEGTKFTGKYVVFPGYTSTLHEPSSTAHDVAFLIFPHGTFIPSQIANIVTVKPQVGDSVTVIGYGDTGYRDDKSNPQIKRFSGSNTIGIIEGNVPAGIGLASTFVGMTDAGVGQGDSGGPLLNSRGEVVGIAHANLLVTSSGDPVAQTGNAAIANGNTLVSYSMYSIRGLLLLSKA